MELCAVSHWIARGAGERRPVKIAIVGGFGGTQVGGSLARAADALSLETLGFDTAAASGARWLRSLNWRLADRRPPGLERFSAEVVGVCARARPDVLIATGSAALTERAVLALRASGALCLNFSTDDPWNPTSRSRWHLRALRRYDVVFTPRRANLADLSALGCSDVRYLPFGYDDSLFAPSGGDGAGPDVLFVGGGDRDRADFMREFMRSGPPVALVGGNWRRFAALRPYLIGLKSPDELRALTASARINLCLVRRANRDGHVMRSFEIAAIGGCMLAEDTAEHREIFGPDGECVAYFRGPADAAARALSLLADDATRARLAASLRARNERGGHTYRDRLRSMLSAAGERLRTDGRPSTWRTAS